MTSIIQAILMVTGAVTISCFGIAVLILCVGSRRPADPINIPDNRDIQVVADELTEHDRVPMAWEHWEEWPRVL